VVEQTAHNIFVRKPEETRPHAKPRRRWEDIKIDLKEILWESVD
jgi:hypothetical protein